jgi:tRNA(Glu) U13 pseudouridine synthase TruD
MRLRPLRPVLEVLENGDLQFQFDLPKGTYATTLLRELAILDEGA